MPQKIILKTTDLCLLGKEAFCRFPPGRREFLAEVALAPARPVAATAARSTARWGWPSNRRGKKLWPIWSRRHVLDQVPERRPPHDVLDLDHGHLGLGLTSTNFARTPRSRQDCLEGLGEHGLEGREHRGVPRRRVIPKEILEHFRARVGRRRRRRRRHCELGVIKRNDTKLSKVKVKKWT